MILQTSQTDAPLRIGRFNPLEAIVAWPADEPLAVVRAGARGRWTMLARPSETRFTREATALVPPSGVGGARPFGPGWIGMITYEAGRAIETRAAHRTRPAHAAPGVWRRVDGALVHDASDGSWRVVGDASHVPDLAIDRGRRDARAGEAVSLEGRERYMSGVERTIEYIRAGDVYQANIAHRLAAGFEGSARRLFVHLMHASGAWHGAYVEWDEGSERHAVCSASPELFLSLDADGRVVTRPMKGTARAGAAETALDGAKDKAELNMIVDLMRNDLGRVCACGSVRVEHAREIERHGALLQGVATVSGRLRQGVDANGLIQATFPAGSVTGAPKIRAMQIIDELEGFERGAFCGSLGFAGDDGGMHLNVGIRTASISGTPSAAGLDAFEEARLTYPVGAGIVADSDPESEWLETLAKAGVLREALAALRGEA